MQDRLSLFDQVPQVYQAMVQLETQTRQLVEPVLSHLVKIRASQINGCAFCLDMHTKDARAAGETEQRIHTLPAWRETPFFSEREQAALALCEAITLVHQDHVPDAVYEQAAAQFEPDELAGLIGVITTINAWNRIAITSRSVPGSHQPAQNQ